ncbi:AmpG family muropeptide MFS transporter [Brevundimonas sp.]|jgi:PAT family beta-lactamase induction signal transducer AmpG|uniref:AmpG family muropeptide MFS transporter n=1 Tax=Brevundimonas sp. TaxID=1871086 RepID=UPI002E0FE309|nr:MFS transporter [Brevundimonas sp.]
MSDEKGREVGREERRADSASTVGGPEGPRTAKAASTMDVIRALGRRRVLVMLLIGFGSGLPFFLVGNTLGLWLAEDGVELAAIGFISWVGLAYSFKFLWAPIIDRFDVPVLGKLLGRRRGWLLLSQAMVGLSIIAMALIGPQGGLTMLGVAALVTAFSAATQDIVADAFRIETAGDDDEDQALLTSAFQLGYRFAILAGNALILLVAAQVGWSASYMMWGVGMGLAIAATLFSREPVDRRDLSQAIGDKKPWTLMGVFDAVVGPFFAFFKTHGAVALLMLAAISLYRLPDFVMGPMTGPFYLELGLTLPDIAAMRLSAGLAGTILGIVSAGLFALRFGFGATLLVGAFVGPMSNLGYTILAVVGLSTPGFATVLFVENFSEGFAGGALVAYMGSLTSIGYTATQYALLSSFYALLGKFLKGFSGLAVETLQAGRTEMEGFALFFAGTAAVGIPALILCWMLQYRTKKQAREAAG